MRGEALNAKYDGSTPLKNAKRELFAHEYLLDRNQTQAALRAGYAKKSAKQQASAFMTNHDVRARVRWLIAQQFERKAITTEAIFDEIGAIAFANARRYFTVDDSGDVVLFPWGDMPDHAFAVVAEISQTVTAHGGTRRMKLHPKLDALETLAKLKNITDEDTPEERAESIAALLAELREASYTEPDDE